MRLLSDATSTPMAEVREVIVARIRCWWTPCPNWTSEWRSSRKNGMSRLTASSMSAWVDGPKACRSASRISDPARRAAGVRAIDQALIDEAVSRDIPFIRLDRHSLVQFGHGVHQQRIRATMTSLTSAIGVDVASDKSLTKWLLDSAGLPVPRAESSTSEEGAVAGPSGSGIRAWSSHSTATTAAASTSTCVRGGRPLPRSTGAGARAGPATSSSRRYVAGNDYRCLVIGGKVAAIAERVPASVTGDGEHTVRELVDIANSDPRRGIGHEKVLTRIKVDEAAEELVAAQGLALDEVLPAGTWVKLALTGNMSTGGTSIDRTIEAHPDNVEIAETAAQIVGLDVAGIDFICPDITNPVRETGGAIVEVNAAPGFRMHTHPTEGEPQYVARPVIDLLFPAGLVGADPDHRRDRHERQDDDGPDDRAHPQADGPARRDDLDRRHRGRRPAHQEGRHVRAEVGPDGAPEPDRRHRRVRGGARRDPARGPRLRPQRRGRRDQRDRRSPRTRWDRLDRPAGQRQGCRGRGRAAVGDARAQRGRQPRLPDGPPLRGPGRPVQHGHEQGRGRLRPGRRPHESRGDAAFCLEPSSEGELIVLRLGSRTMPVLYTHLIPATFGGRARMNVANALAAAAAAWAAGAHLHDIRQGLRTFSTSFFQAPGRLNLVDVGGVRVVIDYCHNVDGMRQLADFVSRMMVEAPTKPGRVGAGGDGRPDGPGDRRPGIPGDRRDEDQRQYGAIAAGAFDEIIVREDNNLRGRAPGETATNVDRGRPRGQARRGWPGRAAPRRSSTR